MSSQNTPHSSTIWSGRGGKCVIQCWSYLRVDGGRALWPTSLEHIFDRVCFRWLTEGDFNVAVKLPRREFSPRKKRFSQWVKQRCSSTEKEFLLSPYAICAIVPGENATAAVLSSASTFFSQLINRSERETLKISALTTSRCQDTPSCTRVSGLWLFIHGNATSKVGKKKRTKVNMPRNRRRRNCESIYSLRWIDCTGESAKRMFRYWLLA